MTKRIQRNLVKKFTRSGHTVPDHRAQQRRKDHIGADPNPLNILCGRKPEYPRILNLSSHKCYEPAVRIKPTTFDVKGAC